MAYIKVIQHDEAQDELKNVYDNLVKTRGKLAEVHKIQSLNPQSIIDHMDLYMTIMFGKSPLKRYQREMIAVIVSVSNNCQYCKTHHGEALLHFWKEESKVKQLGDDYTKLGLPEIDLVLCEYASMLTKTPNSGKEKVLVDKLKNLGVEDRSILDATLVIGYFNFVNRIVLGLGVHLEKEAGKGYEYD